MGYRKMVPLSISYTSFNQVYRPASDFMIAYRLFNRVPTTICLVNDFVYALFSTSYLCSCSDRNQESL
jgi:hypothetical protein